MQRYLKSLLLTSTAIFAFSVQSFGQSTLLFETLSAPESGQTNFSTAVNPGQVGKALIQTFTSASAIQSITYRFDVPTSGSALLNAYFTEWNPATNRAVGSSIFSQQVTISGANNPTLSAAGATYNAVDFQFVLNATLTSSSTYAMILLAASATPSPSGFKLLNITDTDPFIYGEAFTRTGITNTSLAAGFAALTSLGGSAASGIGGPPGSDFGFSAISITIVPEPSTAAAAIVAGFLGVMVIRRRLQRTKVQPVTIA